MMDMSRVYTSRDSGRKPQVTKHYGLDRVPSEFTC